MTQIIVNQGRVGDRAPRMIAGAQFTGARIAADYRLPSQTVGTPSPARADDWSEALPQAAETLRDLAAALDATFEEGQAPIILSSTCSASLATIPVVHRHYPEVVVLYVDGHGDFNIPDDTETGYLGGMVLSGACGLWDSGYGGTLPTTQAVLVGSRDIDEPEQQLIDAHQLRRLLPKDATPDQLRDAIGDRPVWVHVDWDVLEPGFIPADYVVPDGLTPNQMRELFAAIPADQLVGFELAEFNAPEDDQSVEEGLAILMDIVSPLMASLTSSTPPRHRASA